MPRRYPGGRISKTAPTPTGPFETGTAPGIWSLEEQAQFVKQGIWPTAGLAPPFIEDVFSCFLYTGNGNTAPETQTINNGIDLSGKGGLVWIKNRTAATNNLLFDTTRGATKYLSSNTTTAETTDASTLTSFNNNGFSVYYGQGVNGQGSGLVSWTFREQPKFFDVVTYTGNQAVGHNIPHNLGSAPGLIIVKAYDGDTRNWFIYHRSLGATKHLVFTTAAETVQTDIWNDTEPTSTQFTVGDSSNVNQNGRPYIAYLFAHNAGGFGLTGTDNVISCGSFTTGNGGKMSAPVNLGYEPQWLMIKNSGASENWTIYDTMRGLSFSGYKVLYPNLSNAEDSSTTPLAPTATGFDTPTASGPFANGSTYIYIAIRRGPMKVPTLGTSVFDISTVSSSSGPVPGPTPTDMTLNKPSYNFSANSWRANDRLRGGGISLFPNTTGAESNENYVFFDTQSGLRLSSWPIAAAIWYNFRRAPSFFDEVCYTGTGSSSQSVTHNLTVTPELYLIKRRNGAGSWWVWSKTFASSLNDYMILNQTDAVASDPNYWHFAPTSTTFAPNGNTRGSGETYVAYLFASCAGVSRVGSYTGTSALQTINCGFTGGARFVLIKRTDSTGNWWVYDSARGITSGNDPYLYLNSGDAEVTGTNYVDTTAVGFQVTAAAPAELNATGGTYIFLAIA